MGWQADEILWHIEQRFAADYFMIRETGVFEDIGRPDAILIPFTPHAHPMTIRHNEERPSEYSVNNTSIAARAWAATTLTGYFQRPRIIGIEVKRTKADFKKGIDTGQFLRYYSKLGGLFVATTHGICKTQDIPDGIGHLLVTDNRVTVKRYPEYHEVIYTQEEWWRLLFAIMEKIDIKLSYNPEYEQGDGI